jgi:hypothetical protein
MRVQQIVFLGGLGAVLAAPITEPEPAPIALDYGKYGGKFHIIFLYIYLTII